METKCCKQYHLGVKYMEFLWKSEVGRQVLKKSMKQNLLSVGVGRLYAVNSFVKYVLYEKGDLLFRAVDFFYSNMGLVSEHRLFFSPLQKPYLGSR